MIPLEPIVRGGLHGSAWKAYKQGRRDFNGYALPDGLKENDILPQPIFTPTEKSDTDPEIGYQDILDRKIFTPDQYDQLLEVSLELFRRGQETSLQVGLVMGDTKYEFGIDPNTEEIVLADEANTPDSSRFFEAQVDGFSYKERLESDLPQIGLSKQFFRDWVLEQGYIEGQPLPEVPDEVIGQLSDLYIGLHDRITGKQFEPELITASESVRRIQAELNNLRNT